MADPDRPSMKWLGLGTSASAKSSATRDGERQKREAQNAYSQTLPPSNQMSMDQAQQRFVAQLTMPVGAAGTVSAPIANTPSQAELAVLQDLGWQTPGLKDPAGKKPDDDLFNYQDKRIQKSQGFDYGLSDQQIKGLEDLYKDVPGFKPPDENTATAIRAMAESNELAPVTWKQWDKMTPDQQQAATWNSELWKATQKDLKLAGKRSQQQWSPERQQKYDERVTAIFGETGGSEVRAINTLKLLEEIDFTAVGQDLDEYLAGDRLITEDEMKNFKAGTSEPVAPEIKTAASQSAAPRAGYPGSFSPVGPAEPKITTEITNFADLRSSENLAKLDASAVRALDSTIRERMGVNDDIGWNVPSTLGLKKMTPDDFPMGYANPGFRNIDPDSQQAGLEQWYKDMWLNINDPEQKVGDVLQAIEKSFTTYKFSSKEQQEVWDWLNQRTAWNAEYGQPQDSPFPLRDPQEIRKALGWEK